MIRTAFRAVGRGVRQAGLHLPAAALRLAARRAETVEVAWRIDPSALRRATRLLITVHPAGQEEIVLKSVPRAITGASGTETIATPPGAPEKLVVRASAFNRLRQRSDPLETSVD